MEDKQEKIAQSIYKTALLLLIFSIIPFPALAIFDDEAIESEVKNRHEKIKNELLNLNISNHLIKKYPGKIIGGSEYSIIWFDSTASAIQDSTKVKSYEELIETTDIQDMFHFEYPIGPDYEQPGHNHDPGRIRNEAFFKKMYGATEQQVRDSLVEITWLPQSSGQKLLATKINGVAEKLQEISNELDTLPHLQKYLLNPGGTFNWRYIAGTKRLSAHSFGIAIDIGTKHADYWKWAFRKDGGIEYRNRIPWEIVKIFERRGFIWGGKWYHYDTMHFEYRPELFD
jgi:peptidoglycan L-alanyl-D-glutamate endopeptidase CwlK